MRKIIRKAVIDIGTNSCRLFIGEVEGDKIVKKLYKAMEITRLGEGVDKARILSKEAIYRTIEVLKKYRNKIDEYSVKDIKVIATSATRDAKNREEFIKKVKEEANLDIICISGEEEGRYSFTGALLEFDNDIVVIDIGGGSTEVIGGNKEEINYIKSFDVGVVRLKEKYFSQKVIELDKAKKWVFEILKEIKKFSGKEFTLVGVAGTVTTHVSVLLEMKVYDSNRVHLYNLTKLEIEKNLKLFSSLTLEERKKIPGLHPKRAEVIISGSYLLLWILELLEKEEIIVSENDILEGVMISNTNY